MSSFSKKKMFFYFFYFPVRSIPTFIFATLWVQRTTERVLLCEHHGLEAERGNRPRARRQLCCKWKLLKGTRILVFAFKWGQ